MNIVDELTAAYNRISSLEEEIAQFKREKKTIYKYLDMQKVVLNVLPNKLRKLAMSYPEDTLYQDGILTAAIHIEQELERYIIDKYPED